MALTALDASTVAQTLKTTADPSTAEKIIHHNIFEPDIVNWAPSVYVGSTTAGYVIAATEIIAAITRADDVGAMIEDIIVVNKDDVSAAIDIVLLDANVAVGSENAAPSITDDNAANILAIISILTSDWKDLGGVKVANVPVNRIITPVAGGNDIYGAIVDNTGSVTWSAGGLVIRFKVSNAV